MSNYGDWIPGTKIRIHRGKGHVILSEVTEASILKAVKMIEDEGDIDECFRI